MLINYFCETYNFKSISIAHGYNKREEKRERERERERNIARNKQINNFVFLNVHV